MNYFELLDDQISNKFKNLELWLNVFILLSQVSHGEILTCDRMQKCGFQGPSFCHLCRGEEEFAEYLLNSCSFVSVLLGKGDSTFRKYNTVRSSDPSTISEWRGFAFSHAIVNRA